MKKMLIPIILITTAILLIGCDIPTAEGMLVVNVLDNETREPIQGAEVSAITVAGEKTGVVYTDIVGRAELTLKAGVYDIKVSAKGYQQELGFKHTIIANQTTEKTVTLTKEAELPEGAYTKGDKIPITAKDGTQYNIIVGEGYVGGAVLKIKLLLEDETGTIVPGAQDLFQEGDKVVFQKQYITTDILERDITVGKIVKVGETYYVTLIIAEPEPAVEGAFTIKRAMPATQTRLEIEENIPYAVLPGLAYGEATYTYNNTTFETTVQEKLELKATAVNDDNAIEVLSGGMKYILDLGTGIPIYETSTSTEGFTDGAEDNIAIPFMGETYQVKSISLGYLGNIDQVKQVELSMTGTEEGCGLGMYWDSYSQSCVMLLKNNNGYLYDASLTSAEDYSHWVTLETDTDTNKLTTITIENTSKKAAIGSNALQVGDSINFSDERFSLTFKDWSETAEEATITLEVATQVQ